VGASGAPARETVAVPQIFVAVVVGILVVVDQILGSATFDTFSGIRHDASAKAFFVKGCSGVGHVAATTHVSLRSPGFCGRTPS
jgi:hypothetical protein